MLLPFSMPTSCLTLLILLLLYTCINILLAPLPCITITIIYMTSSTTILLLILPLQTFLLLLPLLVNTPLARQGYDFNSGQLAFNWPIFRQWIHGPGILGR